jgi:hypothetical protein
MEENIVRGRGRRKQILEDENVKEILNEEVEDGTDDDSDVEENISVPRLPQPNKEILASDEELKTGKRSFKVEYNGVDITLSVRKPTTKEIEIADWEFSRYFNKAITQGIIPEGRMLEILKEQGVWSDEKDNEINELTKKLVELEEKLTVINEETRDYDVLIKIKKELKDTRNEIWTKRITKQQYLTHTAENKADEHRNKVIVSLVTEYNEGPKKGKKFFESLDHMLIFDNQILVNVCMVNYMTLSNGLATNFLENAFPEDKKEQWEIEEEKRRM